MGIEPGYGTKWVNVIMVVLICAALATTAEEVRFVVRGPQQVTDGWVASSGSAFDSPVLRNEGDPGDGGYPRAFIKFDLSEINPGNYAHVKRATLQLDVTAVNNPEEEVTTAAAATVPWTQRATWNSRDGDQPWPEESKRTSIDYAARETDSTSQVITRPGLVDIDVTGIVDAWLYQDLPNYGLLIHTGGDISGPGSEQEVGSWELSFASTEAESARRPALVIEMTGTAPTPETIAERTLRWFPSALLAPVRDPYIFYWGFGTAPDFPGAVANVQQVSSGRLDSAQRGLLPLNWHYGPQGNWANEQGVINHYVGRAQSGMLGIMVDEWQGPRDSAPGHPLNSDNPFGITGSIKGMVQAKKLNPSFFITVAWRGEMSIEPATEVGLPDMLLIESYSHLRQKHDPTWNIDLSGVKKRIDTARKLGMIERTIPWLGMILQRDDYNEAHGVLTAEIVEEQIAELRRYAPEMPGVAFYRNDDPELAQACDRLCRKYFVEPAPKVEITNPQYEAALGTTDHVPIRCAATPKENRTIREYKWFIDNRLVAITNQPQYIWDLRGETNGYHFVTVHAVDDAYNRAASQIMVNVER